MSPKSGRTDIGFAVSIALAPQVDVSISSLSLIGYLVEHEMAVAIAKNQL
jgi:hypothetical protein